MYTGAAPLARQPLSRRACSLSRTSTRRDVLVKDMGQTGVAGPDAGGDAVPWAVDVPPQGASRARGIAVRLGGEEFALLSGAPLGPASVVAEGLPARREA